MTTRDKKNEEKEEKKRNVGLDSVVCEFKAETFLSQCVSQHPPSCVRWKTWGEERTRKQEHAASDSEAHISANPGQLILNPLYGRGHCRP